MSDDSRRGFVRRSAWWMTGLGLAPFLGSCESCFKKIRNRPIRRSLATLDPSDPIIQTYRDAVTAMMALPSTDGRSWQRQAQIHQDHCPHGNWFFLPWHRAYLNYFEQICRELTGKDDFALPYWDWTADAHVPAAFWSSGNSLFHAGRSATSTSVANAAMVGRPVIDDILNEPDFLLFASGAATAQRQTSSYGRLEGTPHNYVHGFVGGDMGTYMSPLDPIFWMHHNMIECLWVDWNIIRGNANTNDTGWSSFQFNGNFFDRTGASSDVSVAVTLLMPLLSYRFDGVCGGAGGAAAMSRAVADTAALRALLTHRAPPRLEVRQHFPFARAVQLSVRAPALDRIALPEEAIASVIQRSGAERLLLRVEAITPPRTESFFVRVFVNLPGATPQTPVEDLHYAGSFAFFTDPRHSVNASSGAGAFTVDLTNALRRLNATGRLSPAVSIQLVAVPIQAERAVTDTFSAQRMSLELAHVGEKQ
jgi:tyrosinase